MANDPVAIILAAGVGRRLGEAGAGLPKCLLPMGGRTLLRRHLAHLESAGVRRIVVATGFGAEQVCAELEAWPGTAQVSTVHNPDFDEGSVVTLWTARQTLRHADEVLVMDADVLYDPEIIHRLVRSTHANCFLLDRDLEPGEEPVKLCVRDGLLVEFRKRVEIESDYCGESVGFFRFSASAARQLATHVESYVDGNRRQEPHEEAIRDLLLSEPSRFGFEEVTGLPWIEIDFPQDVIRARHEILPRIGE